MCSAPSVANRRPATFLASASIAIFLLACGQKEEAPAPAPAPAAAQAPPPAPAASEASAGMEAAASAAAAAAEAAASASAAAAAAAAAAAVASTAAKDDPYTAIDRAIAGLSTANIAFTSPGTINLRDTAQIELLLSLKRTTSQLTSDLSTPGERQAFPIKASTRMEARLTGTQFQITSITPEEQAIGSLDTAQWKWEIKPLTTGRQSLHLTLTAFIDVNGSATRKAIRTFDRQIEVKVDVEDSIVEFLRKNWQWLWATILVPIAGWLWKRKNANDGASSSPDT